MATQIPDHMIIARASRIHSDSFDGMGTRKPSYRKQSKGILNSRHASEYISRFLRPFSLILTTPKLLPSYVLRQRDTSDTESMDGRESGKTSRRARIQDRRAGP